MRRRSNTMERRRRILFIQVFCLLAMREARTIAPAMGSRMNSLYPLVLLIRLNCDMAIPASNDPGEVGGTPRYALLASSIARYKRKSAQPRATL